jgi:hypothetical protein
MPSSSPAQHRLMAAVAHSPAFAKKVGIKPSVGRDFMAADKRSGKYAEGGEVKPPTLIGLSDYAKHVAGDMYPGQSGVDDQRDAARHMLAAGTAARKYTPGVAEFLGKLHEWKESPLYALRYALGLGKMPEDYEYDLHNNRVGLALAARARSQRELEDLVQAAAERPSTMFKPGVAVVPSKPIAAKYDYAGGGSVNKARGGLAQMKECACHGR